MSEYKGVSFHKLRNKWTARITANGKQKHIGYFRTELKPTKPIQSKLKELNNKKTTINGNNKM